MQTTKRQFKVTRMNPVAKVEHVGDPERQMLFMFRINAEDSAQAARIADELIYAVAQHRGIRPDSDHPHPAESWALAATNSRGQKVAVV